MRSAVFVAAILIGGIGHRARAEEIPTGKLPQGVAPLHYSLQLTLDPRAARFTGTARIRIRLDAPADHIWLHARHLRVSRASVSEANGESAKAVFAERDPDGVAEVRFETTLPA